MFFLRTAPRPLLYFMKPNLNGLSFKINCSDFYISSITKYLELKIMPSPNFGPWVWLNHLTEYRFKYLFQDQSSNAIKNEVQFFFCLVIYHWTINTIENLEKHNQYICEEYQIFSSLKLRLCILTYILMYTLVMYANFGFVYNKIKLSKKKVLKSSCVLELEVSNNSFSHTNTQKQKITFDVFKVMIAIWSSISSQYFGIHQNDNANF